MKKSRLSNSEIRLLLLLGALILIAGSYFLIFNRNMTKAAEIEELNRQSAQRVTELEAMVSRQKEVEEETVALKKQKEEILAKYPSDMATEKAITIVQDIEDKTKIKTTSISFLMDNLVQDASATAQTESTEQTTETTTQAAEGCVGYYAALSMNYEAGYKEFKEMVKYIGNLKDRVTIPSVSASYDNETDKLRGVITVHLYYLTNTEKEYVAPEISGIGSGKDNIFEADGVRTNAYVQSEVEMNDEEEDAE